MKKSKLLVLARVASAAFFFAISPSFAQWQVPDHTVPIGRGAGTGFKNAGAGTSGQCLVSNGASADPTFQTCTLSAGAALTKADDTNVTLTLGGTPSTSLLRAASLTLGWTGQLAPSRGGTGLTAFTRSGNTTVFGTTTGTLTSGNCAKFDANGNIVDHGSACGGLPGGSSGQIQYNNAGALGGISRNVAGGVAYPQAISAKYYTNVSGSSTATTATTVASNATVTLASAIDFVNGQGIRISRAGATFSASPPTAPSATPTGTTGATTYTYTLSCLSGTGTVADGGVGASITPFSTTTGNATLSRANYNLIAWTPGAGCIGYAIYRSIAGTQTLIAFATGASYNDYGSLGITPPDWVPSVAGGALNKWLVTSIVSGGGTTTPVLAVAPSQSGAGFVAAHSDTVALQAWATACGAFSCFIDVGIYNIESTITFATASRIYGADRGASSISLVSPFGNALDLTAATGGNPYTLDNFSITGILNTNSGALINNKPTSGENYAAKLDGVALYNGAYGFLSDNSSQFKLVNSELKGQAVAAVFVANAATPDSGDSLIANNFVSTSYGATAGVQYVSSGGLKIIGNKFLAQPFASYGILFAQTASTSTADLVIANNSIEGQYLNAILVQNGASAVYSNIKIIGNQMAGQLNGININGTSGYLNNLTITGNIGQLHPTNFINVAGATNCSVSGNVGTGTNVASTKGIILTATAYNCALVGNILTGFPVYYDVYNPVSIELNNQKTSATSGSQAITLFRLGLATSYTSNAKCDFTASGNVNSVGGGLAFASWGAAQAGAAGATPTTVVVNAAVQTPTAGSNFVNSITAAADRVDFITTINPGASGSAVFGNIKCSGAVFTLTVQ